MPGVMSEYSFAARKALSLDEYMLLDNQSLVQIMCNPAYVENNSRTGLNDGIEKQWRQASS